MSRVPEHLRVQPDSPDAAVIRKAAEMVRRGLVVAYPTDTLYGLAVDPRNPDAVRRLYELKGRPESSALTLIAADVEQAGSAGQFGATAARLAAHCWAGPGTLVVTPSSMVAREILARRAPVRRRVTGPALARAPPRQGRVLVAPAS